VHICIADNKADEAILALPGGLKSIANSKLQAMQKMVFREARESSKQSSQMSSGKNIGIELCKPNYPKTFHQPRGSDGVLGARRELNIREKAPQDNELLHELHGEVDIYVGYPFLPLHGIMNRTVLRLETLKILGAINLGMQQSNQEEDQKDAIFLSLIRLKRIYNF
jgi:hypothetical protein